MKRLILTAAAVATLGVATPALSATLIADVELDYFNSGTGDFATGVYGGTFPGSFPVQLPDTSNALDGDPTTFISLPTGSFITVGFSGGFVFDGAGNDIFISEVGGNDETADVFVSSDFGATFTFLGTATTNTVSEFDLASIGYTDQVNAVKIVGLDDFGGSEGFDVAYVEGLEGSVSVVPLPASALLMLGGIASFGALRRKRRNA